MKPVKNYIVLVDNHRRPQRQRNTAGRYRVGAKTPKEAEQLLRKKIGFGAIQVYYECDADDKNNVGYKEVVKERFDGIKLTFEEPRHATAPQNGRIYFKVKS